MVVVSPSDTTLGLLRSQCPPVWKAGMHKGRFSSGLPLFPIILGYPGALKKGSLFCTLGHRDQQDGVLGKNIAIFGCLEVPEKYCPGQEFTISL